MSKLEDYQAILEAAKRLVAAEKSVTAKSDKFGSMNFQDHSRKSRAAASDRLTDACHERDKARDIMHAVLVDAGFCQAKPANEYDTRAITQSAGFGHKIDFKYSPAVPRCIEEEIRDKVK